MDPLTGNPTLEGDSAVNIATWMFEGPRITSTPGIPIKWAFFTSLDLVNDILYTQGKTASDYFNLTVSEPFKAFEDGERAALGEIFSALEHFTNLKFEYVSDPALADIRFGYAAMIKYGGLATWSQSKGPAEGRPTDLLLLDVENKDFRRGQWGYTTLVHEIGHALGLRHPDEGQEAGGIFPAEVSNLAFSVMSYSEYAPHGSQTGITPLLLDLLGLQTIYGPNPLSGTEAGNRYILNRTANLLAPQLDGGNPPAFEPFTIYRGQVRAIYDADGEDWLDGSAYTREDPRLVLDLRPGHLSSVGLQANLGIAFDTWIENAAGGGGDDVLVGNDVANELRGNDGADKLYGLDGGDTLYGGDKDDRLDGGKGDDIIRGEVGSDTYVIFKGEGSDTIYDHDTATEKNKILLMERDASGIERLVKPYTGLILYRQSTSIEEWFTPDGGTKVTHQSPFRLVDQNEGVTIIFGDDTEGTFQQGDFGIRLKDRIEVPTAAFVGDENPDVWNNYLGVGTPNVGYQWQGGAGNDVISPNSLADDIVEGNAGSDILAGSTGRDEVYGGDRVDLATFIAESQTAQGTGARGDWVSGGLGDDIVVGSHGNDVVMGGGGEDLLIGGAGNDVISGDDNYLPSTSSTVIDGGEIPERYVWLNAQPVLDWTVDRSNPFNPIFSPVAVVTYARPVGAADMIYAGAGDDIVLGMFGDDTLYGEAGDDYLSGQDGSDVLIGGAGADRLAGESRGDLYGDGLGVLDPGDDFLDGGEGDDELMGEDGADLLFGGDGADVMYGDGPYTSAANVGADRLEGGAGNDILRGGGNTDTLLGGADADQLFGDETTDSVAQQGDDLLDGGEGADRLYGRGGADTLLGQAGADQLFGDEGADYLDGGDGVDVVDGGAGADVLIGGAGADLLVGGPGDDTFYAVLADGDTIVDDIASNIIYLDYGGDPGALMVGQHPTARGRMVISDGTGHTLEVDRGFLGAFAEINIDGQTFTQSAFMSTVQVAALDLLGTTVAESVVGGGQADTLDGGGGNDTVIGGEGTDTYRFSAGMGADRWIDSGANTISIDPALVMADLKATRAGDDLLLAIRGGTDSTLLSDYFLGGQTWAIQDAYGAAADPDQVLADTAARAQNWRQELRDEYVNGYKATLNAVFTPVGLDQWVHEEASSFGATLHDTETTTRTVYAYFSGQTSETTSTTQTVDWQMSEGSLRRDPVELLYPSVTSDDAQIQAPGAMFVERVDSSAVEWVKLDWTLAATGDPDVAFSSSSGFLFGPNIDPLTGQPEVLGTYAAYVTVTDIPKYLVGAVSEVPAGETPYTTTLYPPYAQALVYRDQLDYLLAEVTAGDSDNTIDGGAIVDAGAGDDTVTSYDGLIFGGTGDDALYDGAVMAGEDGNDALSGNAGATRYIVGTDDLGVDTISDAWNATYLPWVYYPSIGIADWQDRLFAAYEQLDIEQGIADGLLPPLPRADDYATLEPLFGASDSYGNLVFPVDTLEFTPGLTAADVSVTWDAVAPNLVVSAGGRERARLNTPVYRNDWGVGVERVAFADGTTLTIGQLAAMAGPRTFSGTVAEDTIYGTEFQDTFSASAGADFLAGNIGADTYHFGRGAGEDWIDDTANGGADINVLVMDAGVAPTDVAVTLGDYELALSIIGTSDVVHFDWDPGYDTGIQRVQFQDGTVWNEAALAARIGAATNSPPSVSAADQTVLLNAAVAAAGLFTASDPDGNPITQYEFWDDIVGGGAFAKGGVTQAANQAIAVTAAELAELQYVGGASIGAERVWVRANDGLAWSAWASWTMTTSPHLTNAAPLVSAADATVLIGNATAAASLFGVTDADGDAITQYEFWDDVGGGGYFAKSGAPQAAGQAIPVSPADLATLDYVAGSAVGAERVWVRAFDGLAWSPWASWTMTSGRNLTNAAPTVSAQDATVLLDQAVAASGLFGVSDPDSDPITQYEFWDDQPTGGAFEKSGVVQGNSPIAVSAAELADLQYRGGSAIGAERVWVRAYDGLAWSPWASWTMTSSPHLTNAAPVVSAAEGHAGLGQAVAASSIFATTDADNDAIVSYELWDDGAGAGHFAKSGVQQAAGQAIPVTAAELADVQYIGGALNGAETLWARAYDGLAWGAWTSWRMVSANHAANAAPVALADDATVLLNQSVAASSLFAVSDADGDAITQYEFQDDGTGGGYFARGGVPQASGQSIAVAAADLASVTYTGAASMGSERLWVRAYDGLDWGAWKAWNVQSAAHLGNVAPTVSASNATILLNEPVLASTLFTASDADGDAIAAYEFWDDGAGGGSFFKGGLAQAAGQAIPVSAAELANVQYVGASVTGAEQVWARASDGLAWSNWKNWTITSAPHLTNSAPTIAATTAGALIGESVQASGLFTVNDADGDSLTQYEVWDDVAGGGYFAKSGVAQAAGTAIPVTAAELANLTYVGGTAAGTEQVWARANDGQAWSGWKNWNMVTLAGMVRGGAGDDTLAGQSGNTVLEGQGGADTLVDSDGNNLFSGGSGNDAMTGGAGSDLFAGGEGDDAIQTGTGSNVIAYNAGDGVDTVQSAAGASNALSLGGGIRYSDLSLAKDGNDLVLNAGANDRLVLKDWYAGTGLDNVLNLQIVLDASADFDANSSDPLLNKRVQQFDFAGLVQQFDAALAASPGLTSWALTNALLQFHLSGADDAALGGDLAYQYGNRDALTGIGLTAALDALSSANFGAQAQALRPFSGLQEGLVKLS